MKLSEMRDVLEARGIRLSKSLGQNFLHDGNQLRRIVEAAELTGKDKVLEIGPGLGPLTEILVERAGEVLAIEKDARLLEVLCERFKPLPTNAPARPLLSRPATTLSSPSEGEEREGRGVVGSVRTRDKMAKLTLLHDDALEFLRREPRDWSDWKLVANLPYSVASPILVELAQSRGRPQRMVATLQLEVARRLMAKPGQKDYGVLTLLIQLDYEPRDWFKIPASCFFPPPDVDSACVVLERRAKGLLANGHREAFVKIVKRGFSQRRKMMMKLLKNDWQEDRVADAFEQLSLSPQVRAEAISLEQFIELARLLHP